MKNLRRILVTGASGFIGSECINLLIQEDAEIYAISARLLKEKTHQNVIWVQANLLDPQVCKKIIEDIRPSHLLHLAWTAKPGKFWDDPDNFPWLQSSLILLESFFEAGGEHAVGLGTCAEYEFNHEACSEAQTPTLPSTLYGMCKLSTGIGAQAIASLFGKTIMWARLFAPYGPSEPAGRFLPNIIDHILMKKPLACGTGNQIRDYIYIKDVADVLIKLLKMHCSGFINIGTGHPISLRDLACFVINELGHQDLIQFGARQTSSQDADRIVANIDRLKKELNWNPSYSLEKGIREVIKYRQQFLR